MKKVILGLILLILTACSSVPTNFNKLALGMSREKVISLMGNPDSISAMEGVEYLTYQTAANRFNLPYFVRIIDGKVNAFGQKGDFNSASTSAQNVNIHKTVKYETSSQKLEAEKPD